jgi:uncharacterized membrane protein YphA (DoxX/SURF4 family)
LGLIVLNLGVLKLTSEKHSWEKLFETIHLKPSYYLVKVLGGLMLVLGSYTQLTAIVFSIIFFCEAVLEYREESLEKRNLTFYVLLFAISLSLIFTGAGAFAFDIGL